MSETSPADHTPSAPAPPPGDGRPKSFMALRHPAYKWYMTGTGMAMMADNIEHVISYWIIYQKFESPALAGFAVFSHWMPFLLFSFWSGALADRFDPRRIIQVGMAMFMFVSLAWGVLFWTDSLEMWHAGVLLTIHGMAGVLWAPSTQLLIHDIVGPKDLQSAVRLMSSARTLGSMMGPAIGGGLMLVFGATYGILFNALFYLPLIYWLWKAPYGPKFRKDWSPPPRALKGFGDIIAAMKLAAANPTIVAMVMLAGAASLFVGNAHQAQMPEFATDFGHGASAGQAGTDIYYTVLLAANAVGALAGGLVLESRNMLPAKTSTAFILAALWCVAIAAFAMTTSYYMAVALLFVSGVLNLAFNSMAQTLVQLNAPTEIRGRVIGLYNTAGMGLKAFSGLTVGVGGSFVGIHNSLALSAAILLSVVLTLATFVLRGPKTPAQT
jgi:MFS family permease